MEKWMTKFFTNGGNSLDCKSSNEVPNVVVKWYVCISIVSRIHKKKKAFIVILNSTLVENICEKDNSTLKE